MRKAFIFLTLLLFSSLFASGSQAAWWTGDGSEGTPFIITDCNQLQTIASYTTGVGETDPAANQYWELGNSLDCSTFGDFEPMGGATNSSVFHGHFDGKNHSISNITIDKSAAELTGLFVNMYTNASIRNLALIDFNVWNASEYSSILAGVCVGGIIENVYVRGGIVGGAGDYVSGLVAISSGCEIDTSYVVDTSIAGAAGRGIAGLISYSINDSNIFHNYTNAFVNGGGADVSAFLGWDFSQTCTDNFYDSDTTTEVDECATGQTTLEMFKEATFTNWNFEEVWEIDEDVNYPIFKDFFPPPPTGVDLNFTTINGFEYKTHPIFAYGIDGNITIDFNVFNNYNDRIVIELRYSPTTVEGSGTLIVEDLNLTAAYCPDQDWADGASKCSFSWNYSGVADGNYRILGVVTDTSALTDFNASDANFEITNDVNLLIQIPIDEESFEVIDINTYSFRVSYSDGNNFFTFSDLNTPIYLSVPLGTTFLNFTIDENTSDYYPRSYYLNFPEPISSATLQPYLIKKATAGGTGIQSILFTRTENNKAVPDIEIRAYRIVPITGKTLMEQVVTDAAGSATFSFVQNASYTLDFLRDGNIFSSDLDLNPVFSSYQFYLSAEIFDVPDENALIFDVNFSPSVDYIDNNAWADINVSINVENTTISDLNILIYLDNNTLYNVIVFVDGFYALPPVSIVGATQILNVEVILTTADGLRLSRSKAYSYNLSITQRGLNEFFEDLPGLVNFVRHSEHLEISTLGFLILTLFICGAIKKKTQIDSGGTALFGMLLLGVFTYMGFVYWPAFLVAAIICFALIIFTRSF